MNDELEDQAEAPQNTAERLPSNDAAGAGAGAAQEARMSVSLTDPRVILAGIRRFGLDGSDLRDLEAAIDRLCGSPADAAQGEAQLTTDGGYPLMAKFKPCFVVNEPMNMVEVFFEDVSCTSKPLIEGVYHWIDQLIAHDDGRVVGLNFWIYKPPAQPTTSSDGGETET